MSCQTLIPLAHIALAALCAPLLLGLINRTKAWFGGRNGPPLLQPYHDLLRLWRKGAVYSRSTSWVFRAAPVTALAALFLGAALLPVIPGLPTLVSFHGDVILFIYLLGVSRFVTVLAALDTASSFEGMGASREVTYAALAEPVLFLALGTLWCLTGTLSLAGTFAGPMAGHGPTVIIAAICLFVVLLVENCRIPFDDPNTHLELTMIHEVMVLDYSGPDLGFALYAAALKLWLLTVLTARTLLLALPLEGWGAVVATLLLLPLLAVLVGVVESAMARLRLVRVPHLLTGAAVLALTVFLMAR